MIPSLELVTEASYEYDQEKAVSKAKEEGFEIVESSPTTLLLDLDSQHAYDKLPKRIELMNKLFRWYVKKRDEWRSKSGNWHVVCSIEVETTIYNRLWMEVCLGSDPKRSMIGFSHHLKDVRPGLCSVLFKPTTSKATSWFDLIKD